ncbi:hypothetical protein J3R82DRAFT_2631 [Butyriboletus roseoflavus]|nr:hypothetical protein J3R82DRAFT_2631 [Butyriboletus roseoflavus]
MTNARNICRCKIKLESASLTQPQRFPTHCPPRFTDPQQLPEGYRYGNKDYVYETKRE